MKLSYSIRRRPIREAAAGLRAESLSLMIPRAIGGRVSGSRQAESRAPALLV